MAIKETQKLSTSDVGDATALVSGGAMPGDVSNLFDQGFVETRVVKLGDPNNGGVGAYIGQIVSEGEPIETETPDGKSGLLPTWFAHPWDIKTNTVIEEVTHVLITPAQLHVTLKRLVRLAPEKSNIVVGVKWLGKVQTRKGRQLNDFQILHKFLS